MEGKNQNLWKLFPLLIGALLSAWNYCRACRNQRHTTPAGLVSESRDRFDSPNQALSCGGPSCHNVKGRDRWRREYKPPERPAGNLLVFSLCVATWRSDRSLTAVTRGILVQQTSFKLKYGRRLFCIKKYTFLFPFSPKIFYLNSLVKFPHG